MVIKKVIACCFIIFFSVKYSSAQNLDTVPCQEVKIMCAQGLSGNYIIENEKDYHALLDKNVTHPDCSSYVLPKIDFSHYTLVGIHTSAGGCSNPESEHHVIKNNQTGNYQFILKIIEHGLCEIHFSIRIFCLIPKKDANSTVDFIRQ